MVDLVLHTFEAHLLSLVIAATIAGICILIAPHEKPSLSTFRDHDSQQ